KTFRNRSDGSRELLDRARRTPRSERSPATWSSSCFVGVEMTRQKTSGRCQLLRNGPFRNTNVTDFIWVILERQYFSQLGTTRKRLPFQKKHSTHCFSDYRAANRHKTSLWAFARAWVHTLMAVCFWQS